MKNAKNSDTASKINIEATGISKFYEVENKRITALQNVNLTIHQGETLAVHGLRKSGKSTLLKILSGQLPPDKGSCLFDGLDFYNQLREDQLSFRNNEISYISTGTPLVPTLTLEENILLPLFYLDIPKEEHPSILRPILEKYNLYGRRHQYPKNTSMELYQLTAFLQAIVRQPAILLADDVETEDLFSLLMEYSENNNCTLIFSTTCNAFISQSKNTVYLDAGTAHIVK